MKHRPPLVIVTGKPGAGKTTLCGLLARMGIEAGWDVAGILSLPILEEGRQVAIEAENLRTGERRRLATRHAPHTKPSGPHTQGWVFDGEVLVWGNDAFRHATPCDLLVVDELGPLEWIQQAGWREALQSIDSEAFSSSLVVVRSELLNESLQRWPTAQVVEIRSPDEAPRLAESLFASLPSPHP